MPHKLRTSIERPDSGWSWVIAGACFFINMMLYGMCRLAGELFVATFNRFPISRQEASFPYSLSSMMRNLSGPVVGYLGHKFGVRLVTLSGGILSATGIALCFIAESIMWVTVFWGIVFGIGFGLGNVLLPVAINEYFIKHRATASGIALSGQCFGSFFLPPLVDALINEYGLNGTFLVLSGLVLNCVPAAMLLRKPSFSVENAEEKLHSYQETCTCSNQKNRDIHNQNSYNTSMNYLTFKSESGSQRENMVDTSVKISSIFQIKLDNENVDSGVLTDLELSASNEDLCKKGDGSIPNYCYFNVSFQSDLNLENISEHKAVDKKQSDSSDSKESMPSLNLGCYETDIHQQAMHTKLQCNIANTGSDTSVPGFTGTDFGCIHRNTEIKSLTDCHKICCIHEEKMAPERLLKHNLSGSLQQESNSSARNKRNSTLRRVLKLFLNPIFLLIVVTLAFYGYTFLIVITAVIDFALDIGIAESSASYIMMSFSVGDLIGHLGLGWITDRGYMTKAGFTAMCFFLQGLAGSCVVLTTNFWSLMITVFAYGIFEAGLIVIFPLLVAEYIDSELQTLAIPSSNVLYGPFCLAVPPLIGYFREKGGSYDGVFYTVGVLSAVSFVAWLCVSLTSRCKNIKDHAILVHDISL